MFELRESSYATLKRLTMRARGRLDSHRQIGFFAALGFVRFVGESRPASPGNASR
jgi:hypothetical protein